MNIEYTYEIAAVDEAARCMEVVYRAEGLPEQRIGARLPFEGEALEGLIAMYAPVAYWESLRAKVIVPEVGLTGSRPSIPPASSHPLTPEQIQEIKNQDMWAQIQMEKTIAKILIKFGVLQSDPTEVKVTTL